MIITKETVSPKYTDGTQEKTENRSSACDRGAYCNNDNQQFFSKNEKGSLKAVLLFCLAVR